jgi:predicted permease
MIIRETRRFLLSSPLLSFSGILVLALGIGASALALALLFAFSSLAYPGMRAFGYATMAEEAEGGGSERISWGRIDESRDALGQGVALAAYSNPISTAMETDGVSRKLKVAAISSGFFAVFTPRLAAGRDFTPSEESQAGKHVAILSSSLAVALFQSPANALERTILLNGKPYVVVGVAPSGFHGMFGEAVEAWVPANCVIPLAYNFPPVQFPNPDVWKEIGSFYGVLASDRLSSAALAAALPNLLPLRVAGKAPLHISQGLTTDPIRDMNVRKWLRLGLLLALFFTIVSSLNYCMLLLARTPRYGDEVRLKKALGASSGRLIAELMVGPAAMVGAGLVAASLLCAGGMMLIARVSPFYAQLALGSWRAALLAIGIQLLFAIILTLVIALLPALGFLRADTVPRMGYTTTASRRTGFLLQFPVVLQIALCAGTWILAGMIVSSFLSLMRVPLGYNPSHLTVVQFAIAGDSMNFLVGGKHHSDPDIAVLEGFADQLAAIPGVRSASFTTGIPFADPGGTLAIQRMDNLSAAPRTIGEIMASPRYLNTMGIRILQGGGFSPHGIGVQEILINQRLAKELWPNENPTDQSVRLFYAGGSGIPSFAKTARVVGVMEDLRLMGYAETPEPAILSSINGTYFFDARPTFVVNGAASLKTIGEVASRQGAAFLPGFRVDSVNSVREQADASLGKDRQRTYFALGGAMIMAIVAYIGLYGALAYYVNTRRRELAVRICLGASPWAIRKIVLSRAAWCAAVALLLSLPLWPVLAQLSSNDYLGQISWSTGRALLIAFTCASVSVLVSLLPAAAAASVSPSEVLKEQ